MWAWRFDPDEFVHVWRETDLDVYPYPVRLLETPATQEQALLLRSKLAARLPLGADADLSVALRILAKPDTRIAVIGKASEPGAEIRMLAAVVMQRAVLLTQEPGSTPDFGATVHVSMGHAARLGQRLAARLPPIRAGREAWRHMSLAQLRNTNPRTLVGELDTETEPGQILSLLERPRTGEGHIRIEPRLDREYPPAPANFSWIDVVGDGRYLIKPAPELYIGPGARETVAAQIQRWVPRGW